MIFSKLKIEIVSIALFFSAFILSCTQEKPAISNKATFNDTQRPPNILLIMADDLGFDDLSVHGHPFIETPNLDQLANSGVQFTDFSVSPVCATTRASLLTGKQFYKTGVSGVHGGRDYLSLDETLISERLKNQGYATGTWGKWHSGKTEGYYPWQRGFDHAYYAELYRHQNSFGFLNGAPVKHEKWVSEVITDYAIEFMRENKERPFFAYASFLAPHEPWLAPQKYVEKFKNQELGDGVANLYGMVEEMDFHIGRLLNFLDESGLAENTIVMFMSDNGPWWGSSNFGNLTDKEWTDRNPNQFRGWKGRNWQNGVKSAFFVKWKGVYENAKINTFVDVSDIPATILDWSNIRIPGDFDGRSFTPLLDGKSFTKDRSVFIGTHDVVSNSPNFNQWTPIDTVRMQNIELKDQLFAVRNDRFKLILNPIRDKQDYPQAIEGYVLIDLKNDPKELHNVYKKFPEQANALKAQLDQHFSEIINYQNTFETPMYFINGKALPISVINAFGPSATGGNTLSKAHVLSQLKSADDFAFYNIEIESAGDYAVYLKQRPKDNDGIEINLEMQQQAISAVVTNNPLVYVGDMSLEKGRAQLKLSVTENDKNQSLDGLRRFLFIEKNSGNSPLDFAAPM